MVTLKELVLEDIELAKDSAETISFKTYKNYTTAFAYLLSKKYGANTFESLKTAMSLIHNSTQKRTDQDIEKIRSLLINSWHTELNFLLPSKIEGDFTRYSLHWAPVQVYYAVYLSLRALFESCGNKVSHTHTSTLNSISEWVSKRESLPYPWNCYCTGIDFLKNVHFSNCEEEIKKISTLAIPTIDDLESHYVIFLKTTRERQFDKKRLECKKYKTKSGKTKKKLNKNEKEEIEGSILPTTFFDCIYRLRLKSNYEEAETYILHDMTQVDITSFYKSLDTILTNSLFVIESIILRYLGKEEFNKVFHGFDKAINSPFLRSEGIFKRIDTLLR